jgi:hypothetical protein
MALFGRPTEKDNRRAQDYARWMQSRNPYAIASVVLGIFSFIELGAIVIFGVAGLVCGIIALRQLRSIRILETGAATPAQGHRLAWTGILLSGVSLIIAAVLYTR